MSDVNIANFNSIPFRSKPVRYIQSAQVSIDLIAFPLYSVAHRLLTACAVGREVLAVSAVDCYATEFPLLNLCRPFIFQGLRQLAGEKSAEGLRSLKLISAASSPIQVWHTLGTIQPAQVDGLADCFFPGRSKKWHEKKSREISALP